MATVLVVEDSTEILSALSEALTEEGWSVVAVTSANNAVPAAQARRIDVVLCDVLLEDSTKGPDLRDRFERHGLGHIPFVFTTASTREMAKLEGERTLRKPFAVAEVVAVLNAALPRPHQERSHAGEDYPRSPAVAFSRDRKDSTPGPGD